MRGTWVADYQDPASQFESIGSGDRPVRRVSELEAAHSLETNDADPVGDQGVLAAFRREHPPVRMSDDPGSETSKDTGSEVMVRMVVRQDHPFDRITSEAPNHFEKLLRVPGSPLGVNDDHPCLGDYESGVRTALGAAPGVSQRGVDVRGQWADRQFGAAFSRARLGKAGQEEN